MAIYICLKLETYQPSTNLPLTTPLPPISHTQSPELREENHHGWQQNGGDGCHIGVFHGGDGGGGYHILHERLYF